MKKQLLIYRLSILFMGLCFSISTHAQQTTQNERITNSQKLLWYRYIRGGEADKTMQTPYFIKASCDGNIFVTNQFWSKNRNGESSIYNYDAPEANQRLILNGDDGTSANGSTNLVFYKLDRWGKLLWEIHNTRGELLSDHTLTPTADGGFFTVLTARHANPKSNDLKDVLRIQQSDGSNYDIPIHSLFRGVKDPSDKEPLHRKHIPVLLKVDSNGMVEFAKVLEVSNEPMPNASYYDFGTSDGFKLGWSAVDDEGNYYVTGKVRTAITIDGVTIKAKNNTNWNGDPQKKAGDYFILKFNQTGKLIAHVKDEGEAITESEIRRIIFHDGKLYFAAKLSGKDGQKKTLLGNEVTLNEKGIMAFGCLSKNLEAQWVNYISFKVGKSHNWAFMFVEDLAVGNGKLYYVGRCAGDFYDNKGNLIFSQPERAHTGVIIAMDATNGDLSKKEYNIFANKGISNVLSVNLVGKKVVATGYQLYNQAYYRVLDEQLSSKYTDYVYTKKSASVFDGLILNNMFIGNARGKDKSYLITNEGEKEFNFGSFYTHIVAQKLPFSTLSASKSALNVQAKASPLQVYTSALTNPVKVTIEGDTGFTCDKSELTHEGGTLLISFGSEPTEKPEQRKSTLVLTSGEERCEITLLATTEGKKEIIPSTPTVNFGVVSENKTAQQTLTIKSLGIDKPISVAILGSILFTTDKTQINPSETGEVITITFAGTTPTTTPIEATLHLSSGNTNKDVKLQVAQVTSTTNLLSNNVIAEVTQGHITLSCYKPEKVNIYSTVGELIYTSLISKTATIPVQPGVYIIQLNEICYKILVP